MGAIDFKLVELERILRAKEFRLEVVVDSGIEYLKITKRGFELMLERSVMDEYDTDYLAEYVRVNYLKDHY